MFSPVKAMVAGALVFLGSAFLIAQPFGQQPGAVPGAETRMEGTRVAVAQDCPRDETSPGVCTWTSGDARLTGTFTHAFVGDIISVAGIDGDFSWADATLEGPDGSWSGRLYISATDPSWGFVVLSGTEGYAGWQYVATGVGGNGVHDDWSGIIYEGELPPFGPPPDATSE